MNKDQIIAMAREAGFNCSNKFSLLIVRHSNGSWVDVEEELTHFAALAYAQGQRDMREASDLKADRAYLNGLRSGFAMGIENAEAAFRKSEESYSVAIRARK